MTISQVLSRTDSGAYQLNILKDHSINVNYSYYGPTFYELLNDYVNEVPFLTISEVEEVRQEFVQKEKAYLTEISDPRNLVVSMQSKVSFYLL